jgi:hypothetical protein
MKIDWSYPEPRRGLPGAWDRFIGPGATAAEVWTPLIVGFISALALICYALKFGDDRGIEWGVIQYIVAGFLAFDIVGGVLTNATTAAKRWYHREGQGIKEHMGFQLFHGVHIFIVAWLFRSGDWAFFGVVYGYLAVAGLVILLTPLYLRRMTALLFLLGAFIMNSYIFNPAPGFEWFLPTFFTKLLVSHLVVEAPFGR